MNDPSQHDEWLTTDAVAAIVIREPLVPVEGADGVFFPATYAAAEDKSVFPGGYNIDPPVGEKNVCLVDSVGSQANRIEPLFAKPGYAELVPQIFIQAGEKSVNLLEAGHRAGDAIVRCTTLHGKLQDAFKAILRGNAADMAKVAPTSLLFGVWDSRDTQAKLPRLVASTIRAFNVKAIRRGAVYVPPLNYVNMDVFTEEEQQKATGDNKNPLSKRGFVNALASATHGGVIAHGCIRRDLTLSLAALRLLSAVAGAEELKDKKEEEKPKLHERATLKLRRYVLGLALVALTAPPQTYLRQGCNLVPDVDHPKTIKVINADGTFGDLNITHPAALAYAMAAAQGFGVGESETVTFDPDLARKDIAGQSDVKQTRKGRAKAAAKAAEATEPIVISKEQPK